MPQNSVKHFATLRGLNLQQLRQESLCMDQMLPDFFVFMWQRELKSHLKHMRDSELRLKEILYPDIFFAMLRSAKAVKVIKN